MRSKTWKLVLFPIAANFPPSSYQRGIKKFATIFPSAYVLVRTFRQCCRKVMENEGNSLVFVCFALVTMLSRPLDACRRQTLPAQTSLFAPVCGCGAVSGNTLKAAQTGFLRGKRGFSGAVLPRPVSLNSD